MASRRKIAVRYRGEQAALPVLASVICVIPVIGALLGGEGLDILRWFVIAQAAVVALLYLIGGVTSIKGAFSSPGQVSTEIYWGRMTRDFGIAILILDTLREVVNRLGNVELSPLTPLFQVALILLLIGWSLIDRKSFVTAEEVFEENNNG